jgi:MFS family permease
MTWAAAIAAAMHASALALALRVSRPAPAAAAPAPAGGAFSSVAAAARAAFRTPSLRAVLVATATMNVFGFSFMSALPAFGDRAFGVGGSLVGLLAAAEPVGALVGGVLLARGRRPAQGPGAFLTGCAAFLVLLALAALSPAYWLCWLLLAVGGVGVAWFGALQTSLVMLNAPPELRSRVLGLVTTSIGFGPLGVLATGWLADAIGPRLAIAGLAVGGLAVLAALAATLRR